MDSEIVFSQSQSDVKSNQSKQKLLLTLNWKPLREVEIIILGFERPLDSKINKRRPRLLKRYRQEPRLRVCLGKTTIAGQLVVVINNLQYSVRQVPAGSKWSWIVRDFVLLAAISKAFPKKLKRQERKKTCKNWNRRYIGYQEPLHPYYKNWRNMQQGEMQYGEGSWDTGSLGDSPAV